jgi:hypothetical protein
MISIEGIGSYGIVLSRIPFQNENFEDIKNLNQVSKILYVNFGNLYIPPEEEDINREYVDIKKIINTYPSIFSNEYFMLPINAGIVNKTELIEIFRNHDFFDSTLPNKLRVCSKILNDLLKDGENMFQITYEKGEKINLGFDDFFDKIQNVFNIVKIANGCGFFFDDIKFENLVIHDGVIKIIDYSNIFNMNSPIQNIILQLTNSQLNCVFYYPYPIVPNILLFEFMGRIDLIGKFDACTQNYSDLISCCFLEYETNARYKNTLIDDLINICKKNIFTEILFEIKVLSIDNIDKIRCKNDLVSNVEIKTITINDILNSLKLFLFCKNYHTDNRKSDLIRNAIIGYKTLIQKVFVERFSRVEFLLKSINRYSLGFILLSWLSKSVIEKKNQVSSDSLVKLLGIVIKNCIDILLIEETGLYYVVE